MTLQWINVALALATYGIFFWAAWGLFRATHELRGLQVLAWGTLVAVVATVTELARASSVPEGQRLSGAGLYAASLLLFFWTVSTHGQRKLARAFSAEQPEHLVRSGPYRFVRHPFYAAYMVAYTAGVVASASPLLVLVWVGMGIIYFRAARFEESKFSSSALAGQYAEYQAVTGMLLPRLGRRLGEGARAGAPAR